MPTPRLPESGKHPFPYYSFTTVNTVAADRPWFGDIQERYGRNSIPLDSPFALVDVADERWWFGRTDSSSVVLLVDLPVTKADAVAIMPTADQVGLVIHTLGFNKRQLGEIFGVTRQAIYDWLKGGNISKENSRKVLTLARLLLDITAETRRPLYNRFTTQPIAEGEPSLYDLLRQDPWDVERLRSVLRGARELTTRRAARESTALRGGSSAQEETNFVNNILSLDED